MTPSHRSVVNISDDWLLPIPEPFHMSPLIDDYNTEGTCKCGLPCPLRPETAFSFDPKRVFENPQSSFAFKLSLNKGGGPRREAGSLYSLRSQCSYMQFFDDKDYMDIANACRKASMSH
ncbi:unnamed protein product [Leptidea sinapis]|uniref:Uncharacterized protein n=1 Tax=Leptidea sinapis TaxID=189913 RepID=A0A5E4QQF2_9NEOP|nr:unnamed protein product [Leptidea sinapis]